MSRLDKALWRDMQSYLRRQHAQICRHWFQQLRPGELRGGLLTIYARNGVETNYLQKRCVKQFTEAAQVVTGALVAVTFSDNNGSAASRPVGQSTHSPSFAAREQSRPTLRPAPVQPQLDDDDDSFDSLISPDHTFETFVTGPENALAHSAAVAVGNQPGTTYNPLFIHGGVGLGKTHLLQAICRRVIENYPEKRICYLSCDAFVNQFLDCIQHGKMRQFQHRYRKVDVLVIDDIHFLANRERTQEEFFHTFNELHQLKHQIVLSSDSPPNEMPQLEDRLVSRFQSGMVAPVARPHFETRAAILRAKAKIRDLELPDDVISYIATHIDSNARELEGSIVTLQGHAALHNQTIDLALARQVLGEAATSPGSQATMQHVVDAITEFYGVRVSDLQSKRRHKSITGPRQVCMWLVRRYTRFSLEEIGGYFGGRDHTTVMHSLRIVDRRRSTDSVFAKEIEHLSMRITSAAQTAPR